MPKYRKKPVVIEAVQFNPPEDGDWQPPEGIIFKEIPTGAGNLKKWAWCIETLEGVMEVMPGDYVIRGVKGELYSCKPDIFAETYEPEYKTGEIADATYAELGLPEEGEPVPDSMPTTQRLLEKPQGEVGFEVVGNKIVERYDFPESYVKSYGAGQGLSDVAKCRTEKDAQRLCDLLNDGRKVERLVNFLTSCASVEKGEHACDAAIRIIERQAHDYQNLVSDMKKHSEDKEESDKDFRLNMHSIVKAIEFGEVG